MKKVFLSAVALFAILLVSCSNEEITISAPSTVNVNASGVISSFIEYNSGELEKMDAGEKLRIRALVYNSKGELVAQSVNYYTNYNVQLKMTEFLSPGQYTVIGISDVVKMSGSTVDNEFWKLSGEQKLSEMKITDQGMIGYQGRILGIGKGSLSVVESRSNSIDVNLKPAGALIYVFVLNREAFSNRNITEYTLYANKSSEAISFNGDGNYSIIESHDTEHIFKIATLSPGTGGTYVFNYILPMNNVELWFTCTENESRYTFPTDPKFKTNMAAGEEFECYLSLNTSVSNIEIVYGKVDLSQKSGTRAQEWATKWKDRMYFNK